MMHKFVVKKNAKLVTNSKLLNFVCEYRTDLFLRNIIGQQFHTIIAADVVYDIAHGSLLSDVVDSLLTSEGVFYAVLPGPKYRTGILEFESIMKSKFSLLNRRDYLDEGGCIGHTFYVFTRFTGIGVKMGDNVLKVIQ